MSSWKWRTIVSIWALAVAPSGSWAAVDQKWAASLPPVMTHELRSDLGSEDYTAEERRNIETALSILATDMDAEIPPVLREATIHRIGMADMARLAGFPVKTGTGYDESSVPDRRNKAQDLVAKDNRLWVIWRWEGTHEGLFYGVPGNGRRVSAREFAVFRFNDAGGVTDVEFWTDEVALALCVGVPIVIDEGTPARVPVPALARMSNNPPNTPPFWDAARPPAVVASLRSDDWPPLWPETVTEHNVVETLTTTEYSDEEKINIKTALRMGYDPNFDIFGGAWYVGRNGMSDLSRYFDADLVEGRGYFGGYTKDSMLDRSQQLEDMIAKGNKVWMSWRWFGTHSGDWYGVAATGRPVLAHETGLFKLRNGAYYYGEMHADEFAIAEQLGVQLSTGKGDRDTSTNGAAGSNCP